MGRVFVYDGKKIPDPDSVKSPEEVKALLANFYPELYNADIKTGKDGEDTVYEFAKRVGTKG